MRKLKNAIGIFGGSFDPPHKGHLKIAKICLNKFNFEKIYWIVSKKNPFKKKPFFSLNTRVERSKNLVKKLRKVEVIYIDGKIKSSKTINVLKYLKKTKKISKIYLILGSDNLLNFHRWTSWKKIVELANLIVFSRKGYDKKDMHSSVVKYLNKKNIFFVKNKLINISSSKIRQNY